MADMYAVSGETLSGIADAIRSKTGSDEQMTVAAMASAIEGISGGDTGRYLHIINSASKDTANVYYCFAYIDNEPSLEADEAITKFIDYLNEHGHTSAESKYKGAVGTAKGLNGWTMIYGASCLNASLFVHTISYNLLFKQDNYSPTPMVVTIAI